MDMSKLSVPQAAERLGVSPARVRQRIEDGSLVAEKIGGRWIVDLDASQPAPAQLGRPVSSSSVWWSLVSAGVAKAALPHSAVSAAVSDIQLSRSSRNRAVHRLADAVLDRDHEVLLAWLSNRASRHLYVAAASDLAAMRGDSRLVPSGVSHPDSNLDDPRVVEAYVSLVDLESVVSGYWLERPVVDERPNVVLHVAPLRPLEVGPMLLAADLFEHRGPREVQRAHELLNAAIDALVSEGQDEARA